MTSQSCIAANGLGLVQIEAPGDSDQWRVTSDEQLQCLGSITRFTRSPIN